MSAANPSRTPVESRGKRVPGLYSRRKADGVEVFEYVGRLAGSKTVKTIKLAATTKTDAIAERESLRAATREKRAIVVADRRRRVNDIVDEYVAHLRGLAGTDAELAPRALEHIESRLRVYVLPKLGHLRVAAVESEDIRDMALAAKRRSRSTVHGVIATTSGLFKWAVKERLADANPVARVRELYGAEMLPNTAAKTPRALSDDEVARAMEHVGARFSAALTILTETGIGTSECLGLTWARVDLEAETLEIAGQLARDGTVRATKTKRTRVIPISSRAAAALREQRARMVEEGHDVESGLVFVTMNGKPQSRRNLLRSWQTALDRVGVEGAGLHSLRHSFVSRLAERNVPVAYASELVGHSRVQTTVDVYTRIRGGDAERLESLRSALR